MATRWTSPHPIDPSGFLSVHTRSMPGDLRLAEQVLATVGGPADRLWPRDRWAPLILDAGLRQGSRGGHGSVRYVVDRVENRSVRFTLTPSSGLRGFHELSVEPVGDGVRWTHHLEIWADLPHPLASAVLRLHDALIEDLFDNAEALLAGRPVQRQKFSPGLRVLHTLDRVLERPVEHPAPAGSRRAAGVVAAATLTGIAVLHAAWAAGGSWPAGSVDDLAEAVIGTEHLPPAAATAAVSAALGVAAAASAARVSGRGTLGPVPPGVVDAVVRATAGALTLRVAYGAVTSGLGIGEGASPRYRRLDLTAYTPLCLALALALRRAAGPFTDPPA